VFLVLFFLPAILSASPFLNRRSKGPLPTLDSSISILATGGRVFLSIRRCAPAVLPSHSPRLNLLMFPSRAAKPRSASGKFFRCPLIIQGICQLCPKRISSTSRPALHDHVIMAVLAASGPLPVQTFREVLFSHSPESYLLYLNILFFCCLRLFSKRSGLGANGSLVLNSSLSRFRNAFLPIVRAEAADLSQIRLVPNAAFIPLLGRIDRIFLDYSRLFPFLFDSANPPV